MSLLKKLVGTAAVVGTTVAATKVSEKVKENNPEGVGDVNGDGVVDYNDYVAEYKKAATELYGDKVDVAKQAVQDAINDPQAAYDKAKEAVQNAVNNAPETAEKVKNSVMDVYNTVSGKAKEAAKAAEDIADAAEETVEDFAEEIKEEIQG